MSKEINYNLDGGPEKWKLVQKDAALFYSSQICSCKNCVALNVFPYFSLYQIVDLLCHKTETDAGIIFKILMHYLWNYRTFFFNEEGNQENVQLFSVFESSTMNSSANAEIHLSMQESSVLSFTFHLSVLCN